MACDRSLSAYLMIGHVVFTITAKRLEFLVFFSRSRVRFEGTEFSTRAESRPRSCDRQQAWKVGELNFIVQTQDGPFPVKS